MYNETRGLVNKAVICKMDKYEKYIKGVDFTKLPPEAKPILIALGQSQSGKEIDQICKHCNSPIKVEPKTLNNESRPCAWVISCECGKCNTTFRGL